MATMVTIEIEYSEVRTTVVRTEYEARLMSWHLTATAGTNVPMTPEGDPAPPPRAHQLPALTNSKTRL